VVNVKSQQREWLKAKTNTKFEPGKPRFSPAFSLFVGSKESVLFNKSSTNPSYIYTSNIK
jgi:hypothetical protein